MKYSPRIALLALGLIAVLFVGGWKPIRRALVNAITDAEVKSMPGDTPGVPTRVDFQRNLTIALPPANSGAVSVVTVPNTSELRIQTITAECTLPGGQAPVLDIQLYGNLPTAHHILMQQQGTFSVPSAGIFETHWVGTQEVSLWTGPRDVAGTVFATVAFGRFGPTTGTVACNITLAGYSTPLPAPIEVP